MIDPKIITISDKTFREFYALYQKVAIDLISLAGKISDVVISDKAFSDAISEAQKDFFALSQRRLPDGISLGKITGVLVFRFSRWHIISLPENLSNDSVALKFNYLIALAFGLKLIKVDIASLPNEIPVELQYVLARRHMNQETLGLCFDLIRAYSANK